MEEFRRSLKRMGKRDSVVDGLVTAVERIAQQFSVAGKSLEQLDERDIRGAACGYGESQLNHFMRALSLYLKFIGRLDMARVASAVREERISKTRKAFALREFRGVDTAYIERLESAGIVSVDDMLLRAATPPDRVRLSQETGVPVEAIVEYVKLADLSRVGALKTVRARLYYDAGVDTIDRLAAWEPDELHRMFVDYVERTGFSGIAPLPKEIRNAVAKARTIERRVKFE